MEVEHENKDKIFSFCMGIFSTFVYDNFEQTPFPHIIMNFFLVQNETVRFNKPFKTRKHNYTCIQRSIYFGKKFKR